MGLFSVIGGLVGGLFGGNSAGKAADKAARYQYEAAMSGIDESRRQFDQTRADFAPWQQAGQQGLGGLTTLLGLGGAEEQLAAIEALRGSPLYEQLYGAGQESILQNASATGGLRGGNSQASLYRLGEGTLSDVIQRQLASYGGLANMGMGAAGQVGAFGANAVNSQNDLRNQGAGAMASAALTRGGIAAQNWQNAGNSLGSVLETLFPNVGGF